MALPRDFYALSADLSPGAKELEGYEYLFSRLSGNRKITEEYSVRRCPSIQQSFGQGALDNAFWRPRPNSPAARLTNVTSDLLPSLSRLTAGPFFPLPLCPLSGVAFSGTSGARGEFCLRCLALFFFNT